MKIVPVAEVKTHLSSYLDETADGPVIITKNGRAVAALVAVTNDEELERLVLAHSPRLRQLLDAAATRVLPADVHDRRPAMRENAIYILGIIGSRAALPVLIEALNDPVPAVRLQAAKALGRVGDPSAVPVLLTALQTADEQLGSQIFQALVKLGQPAVPSLMTASTSHSAWMRWQCVRALGEICDDRAIPVLVHALTDSDHSVAWMGAKSLARFGKHALEPTLRLLVTAETSPWLVETASYVLHELYLQNLRLKPYLEPVVQSMHGPAFRIATPNAARTALAQLTADGMLPSSH